MAASEEGKDLAKTISGDRQKRTARLPPVKRRDFKGDVTTAWGVAAGLALRKLGYARSGIRHGRWPELAKTAVERNVGN
jgi:hypothetical protein